MTMEKFYITFSESSPRHGYYVTVHANDKEQAMLFAFAEYPKIWVTISTHINTEEFPKGELRNVSVGTNQKQEA